MQPINYVTVQMIIVLNGMVNEEYQKKNNSSFIIQRHNRKKWIYTTNIKLIIV